MNNGNNNGNINESNVAVNSFRNTTGMYNDFNVPMPEQEKKQEVQEVAVTPQVEVVERTCPKCGFKAPAGGKMCIHCGELLNDDTPASQTEGINPQVTMQTAQSIPKPVELGKTVSAKPIYIVNLVLFLICAVLTSTMGMSYIKNFNIPGMETINTYLTLITLASLAITFFYGLCMQLLLYKASYPWWGYFIPGYNILLISKLMTGKYTTILFTAIPIAILTYIQGKFAASIMLYFCLVGLGFEVLMIVGMLCGLADRCSQNRFLMVVFSPIMIPITAISSKYGCN